MDYRKVKKVFLGTTLEKDHQVRLTRFLGPETVQEAAPFLLLENVQLKSSEEFEHGFPWRPTQGIESVLYFVESSKRVQAKAASNGAHWVQIGMDQTEECIPALSGPLQGTQLWIWAGDKEPASLSLKINDAAIIEVAEGVYVRVVAGVFGDQAVAQTVSGAAVLDVCMEKHAEWDISVIHNSVICAHILEGGGYFEENLDEVFSHGRTLLFSEGSDLFVKADRQGMRFLLMAAPPTSNVLVNWDQVQVSEDNWVELLDEEEAAKKAK